MTSHIPHSDDTIEDDLLERFLAGACTPDETQRVQRWLDCQPFVRVTLDTVRRELSGQEWIEHEQSLDGHTAWKRLASQLFEDRELIVAATGDSTPSPLPQSLSSTRFPVLDSHRQSFWPILFSGLIVGTIAVIVGWGFSRNHLPNNLSGYMSSYATANGERATVTLPDGSTAVLNVGTRLQVPADYALGNRTIHLTGEAYFTVAHRSGTPFTVVAGPSTTRVLGTRFTVRHYATDTAATVAVQDGRVEVQSVVLSANQQVTVGEYATGPVEIVNASQFHFVSGILELSGIPLGDAIPSLNRWYNADIRITDSALSKRRIKGGFPAGTIADLVEVLELALECRVVRDGQIITLYPR